HAPGKNAAGARRAGKPTLPLTRVMDTGPPQQRELLRDAIKPGAADFAAVAQAIQSTDALEHARLAAETEADAARQALSGFPISVYQKSLLEFCAFAVNRDR